MKENLHQGESKKKWIAKFIKFIKQACKGYIRAYAYKQGLSKRLYRKITKRKGGE